MTHPPDFDPQLYYTRLAKTETWNARPARSANAAAIAEASLYQCQPAVVEVSTDQQTIYTFRVELKSIAVTRCIARRSPEGHELDFDESTAATKSQTSAAV